MSKEKKPRARARQGGRPLADDPRDVRRQLLVAARDLFTRFGFDAVSTRRLAAAADTTPGMIHYYFEDKHGLYRALLEEVIPPVLEGLEAQDGRSAPAMTVQDFISAYLAMFSSNPWLPPLVFREIQESGESFQRHFFERFASRARDLLGGALERERRAGRIREGVDLELAMISVMSLCVFPFMARPMIERLLDQPVGDDFVKRWREFAGDMIYRGVGHG